MIDRRIKFRHIQCFVEICREGSFKRAAQKLLLTQPAISKTLKELEDILGHSLMTRDRSGVALTPDGEVFLRFAQMSVASLQQGIDGMAMAHKATGDTLSLGVLPSVAARLIPAVADRFADAMPDAVVRLVDGPFSYLVDRLKLGELDLIIGRMGPHDQMKGVSFAPLYRERLAIVVRAGHPLLATPSLTEIANWPVVYPPEGSAIRPIVDRFLAEQGISEVPRSIETVSGAFGRVHVQNSDAVWIISEGVVANEIQKGILVPLAINTDTTLGPIGLMTREDPEMPHVARVFRSVLNDTINETPDITR